MAKYCSKNSSVLVGISPLLNTLRSWLEAEHDLMGLALLLQLGETIQINKQPSEESVLDF